VSLLKIGAARYFGVCTYGEPEQEGQDTGESLRHELGGAVRL
jgi:hypothetical protein